jgi:hypothetical protein
MNINQLLNIGNESAGYEGPKSLLDEMMEEIGFESDIDNAIYEADAAAVTSAASIVENVYAVMAEREAGIEGANPLEAYKGFGLEGALVNYVGQEAITDVVARRAYSGIAQLKSLINTLIAWVAKILGLSANTKKIFKSLAEKAKKVRKELSKARAALASKALKAGEDKELTREIPDYAGESNVDKLGINTVTYIYGKIKTDFDSIEKGVKVENAAVVTTSVSTSNDLKADKKEEYAEKIKTWKEDTKDEKTGNDIITAVASALDLLVSAKSNSVDIQKSADKLKKHLEKVRKELENANKSNASADLSADHETINKYIAQVSLDATYMTMFAKFYVRVADEVFTDAKWLIMKAA